MVEISKIANNFLECAKMEDQKTNIKETHDFKEMCGDTVVVKAENSDVKPLENCEIKVELDIEEHSLNDEIYEGTNPDVKEEIPPLNPSAAVNEICKETQNQLSPVQVNSTRYQCDACDFFTYVGKNLQHHKNSFHSNSKFEMYKCRDCDFTAESNNTLQAHAALHSEPKTQCHMCDYETILKKNLRTHITNVHLNKDKYKCNYCNYAASRKQHLQIHIDSVHLNSKFEVYKCEVCDFTTEGKLTLQRHTALHSDLKKQCQLCDYESISKKNLRTHINNVHLNKAKYKCNYCDYAASRRQRLEIHIDSVHSTLDKPKCDILCGKTELQMVSSDSDMKKYKCESCEYSTDYKSCLQYHTDRFHSKSKRYKCSYCDYASNKKSHLREHTSALHIDLKTQCHLCDFSTNYIRNLKNHINGVHLNMKSFKCDSCEYSSIKKSNLRCHIEIVHLKRYKCVSCDYVTNNESLLRYHKENHHSGLE